jgi:hypothetical protein
MSPERTRYKIGDIGPGGGVVFHVDDTGHDGLEARPAAEEIGMPWWSIGNHLAGLIRALGPGWRLPTIEELQLLYKQKETVGGFNGDFHWSSTEASGGNALALVDSTGRTYPLRKRGDSCYLRPIRRFGPTDTLRTEVEENEIRILPNETIVWSENWQYNFAKDFSVSEKNEILECVKTRRLTRRPNSWTEFAVENSRLRISIGLSDGVWKIGGVTRK